MIQKVINKILGDPNKKALKKIANKVLEINQKYSEYQKTIKDQNDILSKTSEFKERIRQGESLDSILPEAYALVKIACSQLIGKSWPVLGKDTKWEMIPYDVQLIGGIVMHQGNIAEMKTGEGKTLVCTLPIYLNALTEKGVFLVTVNEYLAKRDAEWMEGLYNHLGLSVATIVRGMSHAEKKQAYNCDITYGTNNEFGFDYLRDNMSTRKELIVQRNLHFAIIDEVDSILIDEARTPLIISAEANQSIEKYKKYARLIPQLKENTHYEIDEKGKQATLTEDGIKKMEELLGIENIYTEAGFSEVHHIQQALRALACYKKDIDYIIQDQEVIIIDEFTGRLMPGRRYGQGLHQAIEGKEQVNIRRESKTLATVSFQNYFRLFDKLAGMTGTAKTEAEEFYQIYGLDTIVIPTNKPILRDDKNDLVFQNQKGKYQALVNTIKTVHKTGQPILVGTISVEKSEMISKLLKLSGIPHQVLNAKHHANEAEIVSKAGQKGAVTIATNMAGRGTDIKLGQEVKELGGLYVMGTERHDSRRIDNQLRGRSGRQGDPGTSQFYSSMEDDLMRKFGADKIKRMMTILNIPEDMPIENKTISRSIESAQKKVEGYNFDIRKHMVEYDNVMNIHRNIIYKERQKVLKEDSIKEKIQDIMAELAESIVINHTAERPVSEWNYKAIFDTITDIHREENHPLTENDLKQITDQKQLIHTTKEYFLSYHQKLEKAVPTEETLRKIEKFVYLRATDKLWMDHIDEMSKLREVVAFSGMAQKDPLNEYKGKAYEAFQTMLAMIKSNTIHTLFKVDLQKILKPRIQMQAQAKPKKQIDTKGIGRNENCPCGSGKKLKKCCGQ